MSNFFFGLDITQLLIICSRDYVFTDLRGICAPFPSIPGLLLFTALGPCTLELTYKPWSGPIYDLSSSYLNIPNH